MGRLHQMALWYAVYLDLIDEIQIYIEPNNDNLTRHAKECHHLALAN